RKPRLLFDGAVAIPSAYLPPNYADVDGTGTLRSAYNYDAYLTTGSRTSDFNFVSSSNDNTLPADQTLRKSPSDFAEVFGDCDSSPEVGAFLCLCHCDDVDGTGTLRSAYNYDAYLTTGSRTSDFKFVSSYNDNTLPADQTLRKSPSDFAEVFGDCDSSPETLSVVLKGVLSTDTQSRILIWVTWAVAQGDILTSAICTRKPRLLFDGAVAIPSAYLPPNYADVDGTGTLRSAYNYDAYLTTGSRTSDFKSVSSSNDNTLPAEQTLRKSPSDFAEVFGDCDSSPEEKYVGRFALLGEIRTQRDISESDSMKQNLVVSVKDNGQPSLSATCSMYLLISDNLAEVPELKDISYDEKNSKLTSYLIIALVSVSTFFLTFIIIILGVRFCRRRKPRLLFDGAVAIPSAYLPPNYADVDGTGTLRSAYNYDAYLTTGSRTSDFKFVSSSNDNTLPADQTLRKSPSDFAEVFGDCDSSPELSVADINDNPPVFEEQSYSAHVTENNKPGSTLCSVTARDPDWRQNGTVIYSLLPVKSTDPGLFTIGLHSGEIRTQRDISESDSMKQNLVVSVKDNGQPSLSATCSMYLLISDNLAEVPELKDISYDEKNSKLTSYLIIALVSVSTFFLTFIIIILGVRFCRRRKPRLLFDGAVAIPSAYLPPNYADVDGTGTLRSAYNYDAYLTTGSRTSDFKFVSSYNDNTLPADQTLRKSPSDFAEVFGDCDSSPEVGPCIISS
ncbi:hypothetical protein KUCAC02_004685, partial [Chaenocephalus aceratus]